MGAAKRKDDEPDAEESAYRKYFQELDQIGADYELQEADLRDRYDISSYEKELSQIQQKHMTERTKASDRFYEETEKRPSMSRIRRQKIQKDG
jgi:hypothetical protein